MTQVDLNKLDAEQLRTLVVQLIDSAAEHQEQLQTLQTPYVLPIDQLYILFL